MITEMDELMMRMGHLEHAQETLAQRLSELHKTLANIVGMLGEMQAAMEQEDDDDARSR
jgi:uncharacterized membrane protein